MYTIIQIDQLAKKWCVIHDNIDILIKLVQT